MARHVESSRVEQGCVFSQASAVLSALSLALPRLLLHFDYADYTLASTHFVCLRPGFSLASLAFALATLPIQEPELPRRQPTRARLPRRSRTTHVLQMKLC